MPNDRMLDLRSIRGDRLGPMVFHPKIISGLRLFGKVTMY